MTRPLLSLCMIVKDEAKNIRAVLEAALPHVDWTTIVDTGSTDGTQDIAREVLGDKGEVIDRPYENFRFDVARNDAMQLDASRVHLPDNKPAVFQLMLSADEYLRDGAKLREHLEQHRDSDVDCHWVKLIIDGARNYQARVLRTGSGWRYKSDLPMGLHEFPACDDPEAKSVGVPGAYIDHEVSDEEARLNNIWERHIPLLREHLEEHPLDERALTFLAQSYRALFHFFDEQEKVRYAFEMMGLYLRRLALPTGIEAERNYIRLQFIDAAQYTSVYTPAELLRRAQELAADDPTRPEVALLVARLAMRVLPALKVYELAAHAAKVAEAAEGIDNSLSMSTDIAWKAHHLAAGIAKQMAKRLPEQTVKLGDAPETTYRDLAREHVSAGMRAGGSWETFKAIVIDAEPASGAM